MNAIRGRVTESGRISLPAEIRKAVGLEHGGDVMIERDGASIRIRTLDAVVAEAQARAQHLLAGKPEATTQAFIAERHRQAAEE